MIKVIDSLRMIQTAFLNSCFAHRLIGPNCYMMASCCYPSTLYLQVLFLTALCECSDQSNKRPGTLISERVALPIHICLCIAICVALGRALLCVRALERASFVLATQMWKILSSEPVLALLRYKLNCGFSSKPLECKDMAWVNGGIHL